MIVNINIYVVNKNVELFKEEYISRRFWQETNASELMI